MKARWLFFLLISALGILLTFSHFDFQIIDWINSLSGRILNKEFWSFGLQHFGIELIVLGGVLFFSRFLQPERRIIFSIIVLTLLYFFFLFQNAVNIPITDDYITILDFSNQYFFTESSSEKFHLLVSFHGECRLLLTRIAIIVLHLITGAVNIKALVLIANCCLPLILLLLYKSAAQIKQREEIILAIALLLFHFGYYDAIVWATDALHYQFAILFFIAALYFIGKPSLPKQITALACALCASLSFGNGMLAFPIVLFYLLIHKKWKGAAVWTIVAIAFSAVYFQGFSQTNNVAPSSSIMDYFIYSCCFIGGSFQFMYKLHLPFLMGLAVWIFFILLTIKKYYRTNFVIYGIILFALLSSLIAARFRLNMGLSEAISNRYGIFSLITICAVIISAFEIASEKRQKAFFLPAIVVTLIYHLLSGIFFFPEVPVRKQKLEAFISDIKSNHPFAPIDPIIPQGADSIVHESMKKEIYFP